jgi:type I restriction enzyme S subunit
VATYSETEPNGRWRCFSEEEVKNADNLDFKWLDLEEKDERTIAEVLDDMQAEADGIAESVARIKELLGEKKNNFYDNNTIKTLQVKLISDCEALKSKLIDAGIQGRLTEQFSEDGTAEELYAEIQMEKNQLINEGKIKKEKALPEITKEEIPFEIPRNWKWVRWGNLSESIQYGYNAPAKSEGRIKMVRISDIQENKVLWDNVPYCDIEEENIDLYLLHENDILFARTGGTVGKSYIVSEIPEEAVYAGYLIRTSYSSMLCTQYMKYFMESSLYWKQLKNGTIATAQPNCNGKTLAKMILPLPPLSEQKRIVEKLNQLLRFM